MYEAISTNGKTKRVTDSEFIAACRRSVEGDSSKTRESLANECGMTVSAFNVRHSTLNTALRKAIALQVATESDESGKTIPVAEYDDENNLTTFGLDSIRLGERSLSEIPDKVRELYTWRKTESGRLVVDQSAEIVERSPGVIVVKGKVLPCEMMTCGNSIPVPDGRGQSGRKATPLDVNSLLDCLL